MMNLLEFTEFIAAFPPGFDLQVFSWTHVASVQHMDRGPAGLLIL